MNFTRASKSFLFSFFWKAFEKLYIAADWSKFIAMNFVKIEFSLSRIFVFDGTKEPIKSQFEGKNLGISIISNPQVPDCVGFHCKNFITKKKNTTWLWINIKLKETYIIQINLVIFAKVFLFFLSKKKKRKRKDKRFWRRAESFENLEFETKSIER